MPYFFSLGVRPPLLRLVADRYDALGRFMPLVGALLVSLWVRWRRGSVFAAGAATLALFLLAAVGFGVQYPLYLAPFLFACTVGLGLAYATTAGLFVGSVYRPFVSARAPYLIRMFGKIRPGVALIGVGVWVVAAVCLLVVLRSERDRTVGGA